MVQLFGIICGGGYGQVTCVSETEFGIARHVSELARQCILERTTCREGAATIP